MLQVGLNGHWGNDDKGDLYFLTDDCAGCNPENGEKLGPGIRVHTGGDALVGRIASKVYVVLMTTVRPESKKIPTAMVYLDMSKRVQFKVEIFANIFIKFFERNIWGGDGEANEYLIHVGEAFYKYVDAVSNTVKPFCYKITERQKERVRNTMQAMPIDQRVELAAHYEDAKKSFDGSITFCPKCNDPKCLGKVFENKITWKSIWQHMSCKIPENHSKSIK